MRRFLTHARLILLAVFFSLNLRAQSSPPAGDNVEFGTLNQIDPAAPVGDVSMVNDIVTATNGIWLRYHDALLIADRATANHDTGDVTADGHVRLEQNGMLWVGEHLDYNFKTRRMSSQQFRTGHPPAFAEGQNLHGDVSNQTYLAE